MNGRYHRVLYVSINPSLNLTSIATCKVSLVCRDGISIYDKFSFVGWLNVEMNVWQWIWQLVKLSSQIISNFKAGHQCRWFIYSNHMHLADVKFLWLSIGWKWWNSCILHECQSGSLSIHILILRMVLSKIHESLEALASFIEIWVLLVCLYSYQFSVGFVKQSHK